MAGKGVFLQGKRVLLNGYCTKEILSRRSFCSPGLWSRNIGNRKNGFRCTFLGKLLARPKDFDDSLRGCNLSMFREDFMRVDGFDEKFDGSWGREDSDICYRLFRAGVRIRVLWFTALQYHLYHGKTEEWDKERLDSELRQGLEQRRVMAVKGFSALSAEGGLIAEAR
jgi:GT2 family glycosyltransferase